MSSLGIFVATSRLFKSVLSCFIDEMNPLRLDLPVTQCLIDMPNMLQAFSHHTGIDVHLPTIKAMLGGFSRSHWSRKQNEGHMRYR